MKGVPLLRRTWRRHGRVAVLAANGLMILVIALRLVPAVEAVLFDPQGGIDLRWYHELIHDWFAGTPLYHRESVSHPPALFLLLWPTYGWLPVESPRGS